ncbi:MAG: transcription elongation factor GreA [Rickettsiales bacterium]
MEKIPMTELGFARLEKELKELKTVQRPAVIEAISEARAHGDLSENAEYHAAKEKQSFIEGRIMELTAILSRAEVIDVTEHAAEHIKFGATVTVIDEETEEEITYQIVGDYEADITRGLISNTAPIGRALIGKKAGTSIEVNTPKGVRFYEVLKVVYK